MNFEFKTTNIYGHPKIHKSKIIKDAVKKADSSCLHIVDPEDLPFRLIFGGPKNPCSVLSDLLNKLLNAILQAVECYLISCSMLLHKLLNATS